MGRVSNYCNYFNKDYEHAMVKIAQLEKEKRDLILENSLLKEENKKLKLELEKDKIKETMDCTCSSIPSSRCNFKTGISNSRKSSDKSVGGQKNHKPHMLKKEKVEKVISDTDATVISEKINYNSQNKNLKPIVRYVVDIEIKPIIRKFEIYPDTNGKYNIPSFLNAQVQYGDNIKTLVTNLRYNANVSTDNISMLLNDLIDFKISKGTIVNWEKLLEKELRPNTYSIIKKLLKEKYNHVDESQVNVEGKTYNIHNVSSNHYTMQWVHPNKSHKAIEEIGFLVQYSGTLIKDGTHLYDKYASDFVSCGAHINRYLIGTTKGPINHLGPHRMIMFLNALNKHRKKLKKKGLDKCSDEEYKNIRIQYESILENWHEEIIKDKDINPLYDDERKLQARLLEDEKQHLMFMKDFDLPFTNNRAETDIRPVKEKQKVGIFRNEEAAERYVTIRSNISSYKKNNINVYETIKRAFKKDPIIV